MAKQQLDGGIANAGRVVRVGPHVLRPSTAHSGSVHAYLRAVRQAGFEGASFPVRIDDDGRERLVFIDGEVPVVPYPDWCQSDTALASIARLLRGLHDAARGFDPHGLTWNDALADPAGGKLVCHNDVELSNVVFRGGVAVALLDFELAAPGRPVYDVAQFARLCVPIDDDFDQARLGWRPADRPARLRRVGDATGWTGTAGQSCSRPWTMPSTASKQPSGAASTPVTRTPSRCRRGPGAWRSSTGGAVGGPTTTTSSPPPSSDAHPCRDTHVAAARFGDCVLPFCDRVAMETTVDDAVSEGCAGSMPLVVLESEICSRGANLTAAEGEWLVLVAEFDRRLGWVPSGLRSCAHWLAWEVGLDLHTAYEKVRVAHVLVAFPELAAAMSSGRLMYAKARAITRIVRPDNVDELLQMAMTSTANQVERVVAAYRRAEPTAEAAAERALRERAMTWRLDGATAVITLRLPVDEASEWYAAVEGFVDCSDLGVPEVARLADAASVMAEFATVASRCGVEPTSDPRYLANIHLTADVFDNQPDQPGGDPGGDPDGDLGGEPGAAVGHGGCGGVCCVAPGDGTRIAPAGVAVSTARRMLCDAALQGFRTNEAGEVEIGMTTRQVSRRLKRALQLRDGGCRFPGCTMSAWVDAHHIQHWLDLGPTRPNNLVCLCRRHHRLMHEGHWNITGDPHGELFFHQPDGTIIAAQPPCRTGNAELVNALARTAEDGRCGWTTKRFNFAAIAEMIIDTERARGRSRHCRPDRDVDPAAATDLVTDLSP